MQLELKLTAHAESLIKTSQPNWTSAHKSQSRPKKVEAEVRVIKHKEFLFGLKRYKKTACSGWERLGKKIAGVSIQVMS